MSRPLSEGPMEPVKLGRRRVADRGSSVSTWLRTKELDRVIKLAADHEISVSAVVRSLLILKLR